MESQARHKQLLVRTHTKLHIDEDNTTILIHIYVLFHLFLTQKDSYSTYIFCLFEFCLLGEGRQTNKHKLLFLHSFIHGIAPIEVTSDSVLLFWITFRICVFYQRSVRIIRWNRQAATHV